MRPAGPSCPRWAKPLIDPCRKTTARSLFCQDVTIGLNVQDVELLAAPAFDHDGPFCDRLKAEESPAIGAVVFLQLYGHLWRDLFGLALANGGHIAPLPRNLVSLRVEVPVVLIFLAGDLLIEPGGLIVASLTRMTGALTVPK